MKNSTKALSAFSFVIWVLAGCASVSQSPKASWQQVSSLDLRVDGTAWSTLEEALIKHIDVLKRSSKELRFGTVSISGAELAAALEWSLHESLKSDSPSERFLEIVRTHFYGLTPPSDRSAGYPFLVTGYFQPTYPARVQPQGRFTQPLYGKPPELVAIDLNGFQQIYSGPYERSFPTQVRLRGKLEEGKVIPFYSRRQIDEEGALGGRKLELAYMDPVDAFFLHIQGSGELTFENGKSFWVGYAEQNGHPYFAVGRRLRDHLSAEQMGMRALRNHMAALTPKELGKFLAENPSYIFFEKRTSQSLGAYGLPPVGGRTVAVDPTVLPLGGFGYLSFPPDSQPSRLVLFQDTGGAIKGSRMDLFMGQGASAGDLAGELKAAAQIVVLIPRPEFLIDVLRTRPSSKTVRPADGRLNAANTMN